MNTVLRAFLFLFILLPLFAGAQDKIKKTPKHKTVLSIGLTASPDIYVYDFKVYPEFSLKYNSKLNYSTGLTVVYYPVKLLALQVSLLYSTKGFGVGYNYNTTTPSFNPDSLPAAANLTANYVDLPITLHLNLIHKDRVQLFLAAGIVPGLLINKAQQTLFKNNTERTSDDIIRNFNSFLAGTVYSIGFKYNLGPHFGIGIDPYFRYYLNKIDKNSMSANPVSFGGKFTLFINFLHKSHRGNWGK